MEDIKINNKSSSDGDWYNMINSSLLVVLAVAGNFVAETLNCKSQKALTDNMLLKNIVIYFLIYFTLKLTDEEHPHPFVTFRKACVVWFIFFMFNRTNHRVNFVIFVMFMLAYIISNFIKYYEKQKDDDSKNLVLIQRLKYSINFLVYMIVIVISLGFLSYFRSKRREYSGSKWEWSKFILGVNKCDSLK